jgi:predicted  nucleic acid-binding Zn-ribbon protein
MTEDYEQQAKEAERELADMEERGERVEEHIEEARRDWESKQADDAVPGATGEREEPGEEMPPPDPTETD